VQNTDARDDPDGAGFEGRGTTGTVLTCKRKLMLLRQGLSAISSMFGVSRSFTINFVSCFPVTARKTLHLVQWSSGI
jgi:hypothetical protein